MRGLLTSFKNFAFSGSLVDLAVGLAIGTAFAAVVDSLVADVILPLVAAIFGVPNFDAFVLDVNGAQITYGHFLTVLISFLLLAFTIMLLVQGIRKAHRTRGSRRPGQPRVRPLQELHPRGRLGLHVLHARRRAARRLTSTRVAPVPTSASHDPRLRALAARSPLGLAVPLVASTGEDSPGVPAR